MVATTTNPLDVVVSFAFLHAYSADSNGTPLQDLVICANSLCSIGLYFEQYGGSCAMIISNSSDVVTHKLSSVMAVSYGEIADVPLDIIDSMWNDSSIGKRHEVMVKSS